MSNLVIPATNFAMDIPIIMALTTAESTMEITVLAKRGAEKEKSISSMGI